MELGVVFSVPKRKVGNPGEMRAAKCQLERMESIRIIYQPPSPTDSNLYVGDHSHSTGIRSKNLGFMHLPPRSLHSVFNADILQRDFSL